MHHIMTLDDAGATGCDAARADADVLSLSGPAPRESMTAVLERGVPLRFAAHGVSMHPFIRDVRDTWADVSRAAAGLGYRPTTALADGVGRECAWFTRCSESLRS
jgi:nucleoside-diphosphate-sugar epimerase